MKKIYIVLPILTLFFGALTGYLINRENFNNPLKVKVLTISMFAPESAPILKKYGPWDDYKVVGLNDKFPNLKCNSKQICSLTTGMGYANAATSVSAALLNEKFDFSDTYIFVSGIAGINPKFATIGTPIWTDFVVDFGLQHELDGRQIPEGMDSGYFGIDTKNNQDKGPNNYQTHVYKVNENLLKKAYEISKNVKLKDDKIAKSYRQKYPFSPAKDDPKVTICSTVSSDTWFSGKLMSQRAEKWVKIQTDNQGNYCSSQQEDNAMFTALRRLSKDKLVNMGKVLDLRVGSNIDQAPPGGQDASNLMEYAKQNGFKLATENLLITLEPVIESALANKLN